MKHNNYRSFSEPPKRKPVRIIYSFFPEHPCSVFFPTLPAIAYPNSVNSEAAAAIPSPKKKTLEKLYFYIVPGSIEFNAVTRTLKRAGFLETRNPSKANVVWGKLYSDEFSDVSAQCTEYQKFNHFPGSIPQLGRKDSLFKNIQKMQVLHGKHHFGFIPNSYLWPEQRDMLREVMKNNDLTPNLQSTYRTRQNTNFPNSLKINYRTTKTGYGKPNRQTYRLGRVVTASSTPSIQPPKKCKKSKKSKKKKKKKKRRKYFIVKPKSMSRGRGIAILTNYKQLTKRKQGIVSDYVARPLLVYRKKFDLRIYVLVTSFHPLKIYRYREGLVRFASQPYTLKKFSKFVHLTNYSVNKKSKKWKEKLKHAEKLKTQKQKQDDERKQSRRSDEDSLYFDNCLNDEEIEGEAEAEGEMETEVDGLEEEMEMTTTTTTTTEKKSSEEMTKEELYKDELIKWNFEQLEEYLVGVHGMEKQQYNSMWGGIDDVIVKTLISVESKINDRVLRIPSSNVSQHSSHSHSQTSSSTSSTAGSPRKHSFPTNSTSSLSSTLNNGHHSHNPNTRRRRLSGPGHPIYSQGRDRAESFDGFSPTHRNMYGMGAATGMESPEFYNQILPTSQLQKDKYFEIYGFDVLVDDALKPWLLEVNCCPSLASGSSLDKRVKYNLISDSLNIVGLIPYDRKRFKKKQRMSNERRLIGYSPLSGKMPGSIRNKTSFKRRKNKVRARRNKMGVYRRSKTPGPSHLSSTLSFDSAQYPVSNTNNTQQFRLRGIRTASSFKNNGREGTLGFVKIPPSMNTMMNGVNGNIGINSRVNRKTVRRKKSRNPKKKLFISQREADRTMEYLLGIRTSRTLRELKVEMSRSGKSNVVMTKEELFILRQFEEENRKKGNFKRVFPRRNSEKLYAKFFQADRKFNWLLFQYLKIKKEKRNNYLFQNERMMM